MNLNVMSVGCLVFVFELTSENIENLHHFYCVFRIQLYSQTRELNRVILDQVSNSKQIALTFS